MNFFSSPANTYAFEKALLLAKGASVDLSLKLAGSQNLGRELVGEGVRVETLLQRLVAVDLALSLGQLFQLGKEKGRSV